MNFVPQDDLHKLEIQRLSAQIDEYLKSGKRIQAVPPGATAEVPMFGTTSRTKKKKARTSDASSQ